LIGFVKVGGIEYFFVAVVECGFSGFLGLENIVFKRWRSMIFRHCRRLEGICLSTFCIASGFWEVVSSMRRQRRKDEILDGRDLDMTEVWSWRASD
jgi:hypothetical protein